MQSRNGSFEVTVLDLKGKIYARRRDKVSRTEVQLAHPSESQGILLNLEGVPYIDSAGLGEIAHVTTTVSRGAVSSSW